MAAELRHLRSRGCCASWLQIPQGSSTFAPSAPGADLANNPFLTSRDKGGSKIQSQGWNISITLLGIFE